jgi:Tfp pilus assembly protein PilX
MRVADERGVALIMVLIMMGVLSVLGASLVFVSQTETWSSQNYRMMTEARYAAESGVHRAANFILNSYTAPDGSGTDLLSNYNITTSPVQYGGNAVQLRSSDTYSNYPVASVKTAFVSAVHGTLAGGTDSVTYDAIATLISMRQITVYGSTTPATVQIWRIVGRGALGGAKPARVDVEAVLERQVNPVFAYAAFATDSGCGALSWAGGGTTDSYDSTAALSGGKPVTADILGNVGTNGNLDENGGPTVVHGSLSTPRSGIGACSTGAVTALTLSGSSPPTDGIVELPQPVTYPTPAVPSPPPTGDLTVGNSQHITLTPAGTPPTTNLGNVTIKGELRLNAGTYNINSLTMNGGGELMILGAVVMNVAGYNTAGNASSGQMGTPIDMTGGSMSANGSFDPSLFQITYAGTGNIKMAGGSDNVGLLYAPNATVQNQSAGADWYGAVIARRVTDAGHATIHWDRRLSTSALTLGAWMMNSFTWRRF